MCSQWTSSATGRHARHAVGSTCIHTATHTMSKHRPRAAPPTPVRNVRTHDPGLATRRVITGTYRDRFHAWWKSKLATSCSGRRTHTMHRGGQHTHERIWSTPLTYRYTMNEDWARRAQATRRGTERTSSCTASRQLRLRASTAKTRRGDHNLSLIHI